MIGTLAFRQLLVRKRRSLFLLLGFSLGVAVMIVLLSVGEAMLDQSRDASLVGGGELTVLPLGIDVEAMRTGGIGALFFGIDRARFLVREALGGRRHHDVVRTVSPNVEGKLLYLRRGSGVLPIRAGGEIPSRAAAVGAGLELRAGTWSDSPSDSAFIAPSAQQLYDQIDRWHIPAGSDSTWAEWHYFNVVSSPREWWYVTYLVGGDIRGTRWGGELLLTHRRPDGLYRRYVTRIPASQVSFDTVHADLRLGRSAIEQRDGSYRVLALSEAAGEPIKIDLHLVPASGRYFPPVELGGEGLVSGYAVPAVSGTASGQICLRSRCQILSQVPAYHDHNWGVWRGVTWEWGSGSGAKLSILYGGVAGPNSASGSSARSPFFLTVFDSLGMQQVLRFEQILYRGSRPAAGGSSTASPAEFVLQSSREADTLNVRVRVLDALATGMGEGRFRRFFLQMRGHFTISGRLLGRTVSDTGSGFFETYVGSHPR